MDAEKVIMIYSSGYKTRARESIQEQWHGRAVAFSSFLLVIIILCRIGRYIGGKI